MKLSVIAAFVATVVAVSLALRKREPVPKSAPADADKRYDIDEYLGEEQL
jgi:hypothetical protein